MSARGVPIDSKLSMRALAPEVNSDRHNWRHPLGALASGSPYTSFMTR